jgi:hypothetical protein
VPVDTYLLDSLFVHDSRLVEHTRSYDSDWINPLRSNRKATSNGEEISVDTLAERIDTVKHDADKEIYYI